MTSLVIPRQTIERFSQAKGPEHLKSEILDAIGDLSPVEVMFNYVLVATYFRPEKTSGGIIRPSENVVEDTFQAKVGLVLKMGPDAFEDDDRVSFRGQRCEVGEWVGFKIGDTWQMLIRDVPCRLVQDANIRLRLTDPTVVF
jgi:hypothetical protein